MLNKRSVLIVVAGMLASGALALADDKEEDKVKEEWKKLQGVWQAVTLVENGKEMPAAELAKLTLTIKGSKVTASGNSSPSELVLDPTKDPKTIDIITDLRVWEKRAGQPVKERTVKDTKKGIYTLEGDTLTICTAEGRQVRERPTKLKAEKDTVLIALRRKKS